MEMFFSLEKGLFLQKVLFLVSKGERKVEDFWASGENQVRGAVRANTVLWLAEALGAVILARTRSSVSTPYSRSDSYISQNSKNSW